MEHGMICNIDPVDKKIDESFMHFVIKNVVEKRFRDLIVEIHPPRFQQFFFRNPK